MMVPFFLLTNQSGAVLFRPPENLHTPAFSIRPMGAWKVKQDKTYNGLSLISLLGGNLYFASNETPMPVKHEPNDKTVRVNGLTWYTNVEMHTTLKLTRFSAIAGMSGKIYIAIGDFKGKDIGRMIDDAYATLKTFKPL